MITSQDLIKGIDISGLTTVSASQLIQLVDAGRTAPDKGLTILTTDSALNVPTVPNPDIVLEGVTPIWWKRYIWIRVPFNNTGFIILYGWNEQLASDPLYLKWQSTGADITALTAQVAALNVTVQIVGTQQTADGAAIAILQARQTNDETNITNLQQLTTIIQAQIANSIWPVGSYRVTASIEADSATWCLADGRALLRASYPALFNAIATLYGAGDGITTFNLPDARSRMQIGASRNGSVPAGLTQRIPQTPSGEETHLLIGSESGMPAHNHSIQPYLTTGLTINQIKTEGGIAQAVSNVVTGTATAIDATSPHNNMPPFIAGFIMLKIA